MFGDDAEGAGTMFVRNLVTATMVREELADNPIIREMRGTYADKTIAQAIGKLDGWEALGFVWRLNVRRRWYARTGADNHAEFVPVAETRIRAAGPSVDDLLG